LGQGLIEERQNRVSGSAAEGRKVDPRGQGKGRGAVVQVDAVSADKRKVLDRVVRDLQRKFQGVFGLETVEELVFDTYLRLAATARVTRWLVLGVERFATERLEALVHSEDHSEKKLPAVLFLCTHNAGRSQMALGWFSHFAGDRGVAWSAGSEPESDINQGAVAAMAEVGIDIGRGFPKPWTDEVVTAADVVVTMGCGDACPLVAGKHYEDWEVADPAGKSLEEIRPIRDEIGVRVLDLLGRIGVALGSGTS
jgi:arsenate reductase (thioredoxin)